MTENTQILEKSQGKYYQWIGVIGLVYLLLVAVGMIGAGFQLAAGEKAQELFAFVTNPFAGLIVGILATALIQSSSTITSIIVGLVAGGLPVTIAIPMVMGSNIGTTITNTLVSLGHISKKEEFKPAFAAATIHDFFNLLGVAIFFPLEMATHFLEKIAAYNAHFFLKITAIGMQDFNPIQAAISPVINGLASLTNRLSHPGNGIVLIVLGIGLILGTIFGLGNLLRSSLVGQAKQLLRAALGRNAITGIFSGMLITIIVQSSSTTTSLIVPLAGMSLLTLEEVYPFTLGANIGTCITALLAALAVQNNSVAALQIAFVHLFFNVIGVIVIYGLPFLRQLPILGAQTLAAVASERKVIALIYILGVFFILPGIFLGLTSLNSLPFLN